MKASSRSNESISYVYPVVLITYNPLQTEKYFQNLIQSNQNKIVFTIFQLIWNHGPFGSNHSENVKYNLISVLFNKISLCVDLLVGVEVEFPIEFC